MVKAPVLSLQGRIFVDNFVETPPPEVARKKGVVCGNPLQNKDFTRWLQVSHLLKYATSFSIVGKSATLMQEWGGATVLMLAPLNTTGMTFWFNTLKNFSEM